MIIIQPFSKKYFSGVVDVILPIQQKEFNIPITLEAQSDLSDIPHFYQKDNGNFWIALNGSEVVGTIALIDIGNNEGALRKMFVKKITEDLNSALPNIYYKHYSIGVKSTNIQIFIWAQQRNFSQPTGFMKKMPLLKLKKLHYLVLFLL